MGHFGKKLAIFLPIGCLKLTLDFWIKLLLNMLFTSILLFFLFESAIFVKLFFFFYFVCKTELVGQNDQLEKTFFSWRPSPPNLQNKIWRGTSKRHSALGQITWFLKTLCISPPQSGKGKRFFFLWHWQGLIYTKNLTILYLYN